MGLGTLKNKMKNFFSPEQLRTIQFVKYKLLWHTYIINYFKYGKTLDGKRTYTYDNKWKTYLSAVCVIKNEAPFMKEWIEYYKLIGVEKFFIYDNGSTDNICELLAPYIESKIVEYKFVPGRNIQEKCYNDAIIKCRKHSKWLAICDADEFYVPIKANSLPEFLKDYEKYPGIYANWIFFDSNGHKKRPRGLVTENYTRVHSDYNTTQNLLGKSIVQPDRVLYMNSTHWCIYKRLSLAVTEDKNWTMKHFTLTNHHEKIMLFHYWTKSKEDYLNKCGKGYADGAAPHIYKEEELNFPDGIQLENNPICRYIPDLKKNVKVSTL